jgi:hypothetical protein
MPTLFPPEIINDTTESLFVKRSVCAQQSNTLTVLNSASVQVQMATAAEKTREDSAFIRDTPSHKPIAKLWKFL